MQEPTPAHISQSMIELIKGWEGFVGHAYKPVPTEKEWTIGYGHYGADVKPGMTVSRAEAEQLLRRDLEKFEQTLIRQCEKDGVSLRQQEFDALVSFAYNLGPANLFGSTLWKRVKAGDYAGATTEFHKWTKAGGKVLPGLVRRRAAEARVWAEGIYTAGW